MTLIQALLLVLFGSAPPTLSVEVVAPTGGGEVYVAAYDTPEAFDEEQEIDHIITPLHIEDKRADMHLRVPASGAYVIAAFQDLNGNGELDTNLFGIPTEPYGFAQTPPTKWRAPSFDEVATEVSGGEQIRIELRHWGDY